MDADGSLDHVSSPTARRLSACLNAWGAAPIALGVLGADVKEARAFAVGALSQERQDDRGQ